MSDTALLAVLLAAVAGLVAGRAWAAARRQGDIRERPEFRTTAHYTQGLHYLASGQIELAISELGKVTREFPDAVEALQALGTLLRETGQVERAIQVHQTLLARRDLTRAERGHVLEALGTDFRKSGFLDRATSLFTQVLDVDPKNIRALVEMQKLHEEQRQWQDAYAIRTRLARLRKTDDSITLGYLQAQIGQEARRAGQTQAAERAFKTALSLDRRVFPAHLGLADLSAKEDPQRAAAILEEAIELLPERAYLTFDRLATAYERCGERSRFAALCERLIEQDPKDWRARLALARSLEHEGKHEEAYGLVLRAIEANAQVFALHMEMWKILRALGTGANAVSNYVSTAEESLFYRDPHVCTSCHYRADDMLWRCPHCHEWNTFVEERLGPAGRSS